MKIIKKGLLNKDGIYFACERCKAEFLIEGREDFMTYPEKDLGTLKIVTEYTVICPICGTVMNLGNIDCDYVYKYSCLRKREDWVERYKVVYESEDYNKFWDSIEEAIPEVKLERKACWETGEYDDECCCEMCEHRNECSGEEED